MLFNAAADCWPGWDTAPLTQSRSESDLQGGLDLARRSSVLVSRLQLGVLREGTAQWMIGAYQLALGEIDEALSSFSLAVGRYEAGHAPGLAWLARGYIAIAYQAADRPWPESVASFEAVLAEIEGGGFQDAAFWRDQLNVARGIFVRSAA